MRSTRLMDLLPLGESETITSSVLGSRANSMVVGVQVQRTFNQCKWQRPLELVVRLRHLSPFCVIPKHCWAVVAFEELLDVEQQLVPTLRLWTLQ